MEMEGNLSGCPVRSSAEINWCSSILFDRDSKDNLVLYLCPQIIGKFGLPASSVINTLNDNSIKIESIKKFSNDVRINYKFLRK